MATLTRADLPPVAAPEEIVEAPELGGELLVRGLSLTARLRFAADAASGSDPYAHVPRLLAACVVEPEGAPLYSADEWERLGAQHPDLAMRCFRAARRVSGLDAEDAEKN